MHIIQALYNYICRCHIPIMLASDLYMKAIVPSIEHTCVKAYSDLITNLEYDYIQTKNNSAVSWRDADNLQFSPKFRALISFEDECYAVIFEALYLIYIFIVKNEFMGPATHYFYYRGNAFTIELRGKTAYVFTPEDDEKGGNII